MSHYRSNVRDLEFNLFEVLGAGERMGKGPFAEMDADTARNVLHEFEQVASGPVAASSSMNWYAARNEAARETRIALHIRLGGEGRRRDCFHRRMPRRYTRPSGRPAMLLVVRLVVADDEDHPAEAREHPVFAGPGQRGRQAFRAGAGGPFP